MIEITPKISEEQSNDLNLETPALRKWWVMLGVGMGMFMYALDVYIVSTALPILGQSLDASFASLQWIVLSYVLMITTLVLGASQLADLWSKKWLYFGGLLLFTISSLLCGLAPNVSFLIGFRLFQGIGAALISGLAPAIISECFSEKERGRALGILWGVFSVGIAMGAGAGGLLIALGGWRLTFLINLPIGLIACLIVALGVPSSVKSETKQSFDIFGAVLITLTLCCFALAMTFIQNEGFGSITVVVLFAFALFGLVGFLLVEVRVNEPMLDLEMFRNLQLSLSLLISLMVYMVVVAGNFILPLFLELVKHYPAWETGLLLMVSPIVQAISALVAGMLSDRWKPRILSPIGLILLLFGCFAISTFDAELTVPGFLVRTAIYGLGLGIFVTPNSTIIMGAVPKERLGIASGLLYLSRHIGFMTGLPLLGTLFSFLTIGSTKLASNNDVINAPVETLVFGVQATFGIATLILLASALLGTLLWWMDRSKEQTT